MVFPLGRRYKIGGLHRQLIRRQLRVVLHDLLSRKGNLMVDR